LSEPNDAPEITPQILLHAYASGVFPMSDGADDPDLYWVEPRIRGIMPLDDFHIPKRLARTMRSGRFVLKVDTAFEQVLDACAGGGAYRPSTWINARIRALYTELFAMGHCHSVETWLDGQLVGGLYGVSLGAAFFGESMFHTATDASKVALVHLVTRLRAGGYQLLDTQFQTEHLAQFGTIEVPKLAYRKLLKAAMQAQGDFMALDSPSLPPETEAP
jgi:leucyl/phenylalanyl-tRNA--protein transferase